MRDLQHADRERADLGNRADAITRKAEDCRVEASMLDARPLDDGATCTHCGQVLGYEARERALASFHADAAKLDAEAKTLNGQAVAIAVPVVPAAPEGEPPTRELDTVRVQLRATQEATAERGRLEERIVQLRPAVDARPAPEAFDAARAAIATQQEALDAIEPVDLAAIEAAGTVARRTVAQRRLDLDEAKVQRGRLDEKLAAIAAADELLLRSKEKAEALQASIDVESVIEKACGRAGIPTLILENVVIPTLEAKAAHILAELGTGYRVELRTQKANQDGGLRDTCEAVVIDAQGNEGPYEDFSGGEQTRIGLALQIALAEYLAPVEGGGCLFLDEPSFLDAAGMAALLGVLRDLLARRVFDLVMLVSHVPELRDSLDNSITVVREGGVSRIDVGDREQVTA